MKNKIIIGILTIILIGSIATITAYNTLQDKSVEYKYDKAKLTASLDKSDWTLSGRLTSPDDEPITNYQLEIRGGDRSQGKSNVLGYATTNNEGYYNFNLSKRDSYDYYLVTFNGLSCEKHPDYSSASQVYVYV